MELEGWKDNKNKHPFPFMSLPTVDIMAYDFGDNSYELPFFFFLQERSACSSFIDCYGVAISRGRRHFSRTFIPFSSYVSQKHENPTISSRSESLSISYKRLFLVEKNEHRLKERNNRVLIILPFL